ncbi:hypothetical protein [Oceanimonas smirnovii]|uniref:hypothetical protein n=1 Tax=Oceanimonas smirnovii TaxID=264574 RepID=UPI000372B033|nr:hypothetical protein [Oceanimonas smirnovii]
MYKNLMVGLSFLALTGCAAFEHEAIKLSREKVNVSQEDIEQARNAVLLSLKDPESAKFTNWYGTREPGEDSASAICGEVNARNSYGGYSGFTHFAVVSNTVYLYTNTPIYGVSDDNIRIVELCTPAQ